MVPATTRVATFLVALAFLCSPFLCLSSQEQGGSTVLNSMEKIVASDARTGTEVLEEQLAKDEILKRLLSLRREDIEAETLSAARAFTPKLSAFLRLTQDERAVSEGAAELAREIFALDVFEYNVALDVVGAVALEGEDKIRTRLAVLIEALHSRWTEGSLRRRVRVGGIVVGCVAAGTLAAVLLETIVFKRVDMYFFWRMIHSDKQNFVVHLVGLVVSASAGTTGGVLLGRYLMGKVIRRSPLVVFDEKERDRVAELLGRGEDIRYEEMGAFWPSPRRDELDGGDIIRK